MRKMTIVSPVTVRQESIGIGMILIVLFHFFLLVWSPWGNWHIGFVGVDICLFYSGMGLVASYQKYSLKEFYIRRCKRIIPLYLLLCIIKTYYDEGCFEVFDFLGKVSTLNYILNSSSVAWFLSAILILYILFPLIYKSITWGGEFLIMLVFAILFTILLIDHIWGGISWAQESGLARIPIFMFGVFFAINEDNARRLFNKYIISLFTFIITYFFVNKYLAVSFLVPLIITIVYFYLRNNKILRWIGNNSIEIYCANVVMYWFLPDGLVEKIVWYIAGQIVFTCLFVFYNRFFSSILK